MSECTLCPRMCRADRESGETGFCRCSDEIVVSRAAPHFYEEPVISGTKGSGCIFFSGCNLRCVFCQNKEISRTPSGVGISEERLSELMLELQGKGCHNINLVSPTVYANKVRKALAAVKSSLTIPVVYNCGGYESVETVKSFEELVDIYMPDLKYFSDDIAVKYSGAPDYFINALSAIKEMVRQKPKTVIENGLMKSGVIVRHLILPGCHKDSQSVLRKLNDAVGSDKILLSLMRQYTPDFCDDRYTELKRKITSFEYNKVLDIAEELGFNGFTQDKDSASAKYTPAFDFKG